MSAPTTTGVRATPTSERPAANRTRIRPGRVLLNVLGVVVALAWVFPVYWMLLSALTPNARLRQVPPSFLPTNATLSNFRRVATDPGFASALRMSLSITLLTVAVVLAFAFLAALAISNAFGIAPTQFTFALTAVPKLLLLRVAALAAVCSLMSILFCVTMHGTERLFAGRIPNTWLRIAAGGAIVVVLSLLVGTGDYNGAGMDVITRAIEGGQAAPDAFFWKLLFTAVTIGSGFKGGEVVPTFFIGATLGCVLGGLLGIPAGFAAALGLVCVFCGAVNCPIASMVLSIELFGAGQLVYFALACGVAYMLSGYFGLYSSQKILYSKLRTEFINIHAK